MIDRRGNSGERVEGVRYTPRPPSSVEIMQAYDLLPSPVRRAIAEAPANYNPVEIQRALAQGFPARQMELDLRFASMEFIERAYAERGR